MLHIILDDDGRAVLGYRFEYPRIRPMPQSPRAIIVVDGSNRLSNVLHLRFWVLERDARADDGLVDALDGDGGEEGWGEGCDGCGEVGVV